MLDIRILIQYIPILLRKGKPSNLIYETYNNKINLEKKRI